MIMIDDYVISSERIPYMRSSKTRGNNPFTVWRPGKTIDISCVSSIGTYFIASDRVPDMDHLVSSSAGEILTIRRPGQRLHAIAMRLIHSKRRSNTAIRCSRNDQGSVYSDGQRKTIELHFLFDILQFA